MAGRRKPFDRFAFNSAKLSIEPTQELIDSIYRERVLRARAMPPEEKLFAGPQLFEEACQWMEVGIRSRYLQADDAEVRRILIEQINCLRRIEEAEWKMRISLLP